MDLSTRAAGVWQRIGINPTAYLAGRPDPILKALTAVAEAAAAKERRHCGRLLRRYSKYGRTGGLTSAQVEALARAMETGGEPVWPAPEPEPNEETELPERDRYPLHEAGRLFPSRPCPRTVSAWIHRGVCGVKLQVVYDGGRAFITPEAAEAFMAAVGRAKRREGNSP